MSKEIIYNYLNLFSSDVTINELSLISSVPSSLLCSVSKSASLIYVLGTFHRSDDPLFFGNFRKPFLIYQGSHFDEQYSHYDVFLPSRTYLESSSRSYFLNCEGRPLLTNKVLDIGYRVPSSEKVLYTLFKYIMSKNTIFCD